MSQYATSTQLATFGLPAAWLTGVSGGDQDAHLSRASSEADSYLAQRYELPLTAWGDDLRGKVCDIACWTLLKRRGFNPDSGSDAAIRSGYEDALAWLGMVSRNQVTPTGIVDSTVTVEDGGFAVITEERRGW